MHWVRVAAGGSGNIVRVRVNGSHKILGEANVKRSVQTFKLKSGWIFHQDNDPKGTSKSTMYLQERWMNEGFGMAS